MKLVVWALSLLLMAGCGGGGSSSESGGGATTVNNPPVATNDAATLNVNTTLDVNVLANDRDQDKITIQSVTSPANGSVENKGESITYVPTQGFVGSDSFSYTIVDTVGQTATASVELTINNVAPAVNDDAVTASQSSPVTFNPLANDSSQAGHELTIVSLSAPLYGAVAHEGETITYTPNDGYVGEDALVYTVRDTLGDESSGSININIENVAPVVVDDAATTEQNVAITVNPLENDHDVIGDALTIVGVQGAANGSHVIEEDGSITYTPKDGFAGNETLIYTVADNYGATRNGKIIVNVVNLLPQIGNDRAIVLNSEAKVIDVLANDSDVAGDEITITQVSEPENGTAIIAANKVEYTPNADFKGIEILNYTVEDSNSGVSTGVVTLEVMEGVIVSGKLTDFSKAGIEVVVNVGDFQRTATTNEAGEYSVVADIYSNDDVVAISVNNVTENYSQFAYLGMASQLRALADNEANELVGQDISHVSTALFQLTNIVLGSAPTTVAEYEQGMIDAESAYVLQMTLAAKLILADNTLDLPSDFTTVNELQLSIHRLSRQLGMWRTNHYAEFQAAIESLFTTRPYGETDKVVDLGVNLLAASSTDFGFQYRLGDSWSMELFDGGRADIESYSGFNSHNSWQVEDGIMTLSVYQAFTNYVYCDSDEPIVERGLLDKFALAHMYSTPLYDVYLQKLEPNDGLIGCTSEEKHLFTTVRQYKTQAPVIEPSKYYINRHIHDGERFQTSARMLDLEGNGSFEEFDLDNNLTESGTWTTAGGYFTFDYSDGSQMRVYKFSAAYQDMYQAYIKAANGEVSSLFLEFHTVTTDRLESIDWTYMYTDEYSPFDRLFDPLNRNEYHDDGTGSYQSDSGEGWSGGSSVAFAWQRSGAIVNQQYYWNYETNSRNICDTNLPECYIYYKREIEFIREVDGKYLSLVKNERLDPEGTLISSSSYFVLYRLE